MAQAWKSPKDPEEFIDFQIDWTARLVTDETIDTSTWTITGADDALTHDENDDDIVDANTVIWLSGGTLGVRYLLTNHIITSEGREMEQSGYLKVKAK